MTEIPLEDGCSRGHAGDPCQGEVFLRVSRSGLTSAPICEYHAGELERTLDGIAERYPEVNHQEWCNCRGCEEGSW